MFATASIITGLILGAAAAGSVAVILLGASRLVGLATQMRNELASSSEAMIFVASETLRPRRNSRRTRMIATQAGAKRPGLSDRAWLRRTSRGSNDLSFKARNSAKAGR